MRMATGVCGHAIELVKSFSGNCQGERPVAIHWTGHGTAVGTSISMTTTVGVMDVTVLTLEVLG
ncbi:MAG TPA: hypothetical protein VMP11_02405 [Verrucomicrobiae bacterium]|nr:hypothetical protein [Verrucomicrobiae bacterium]